MTGQPLVAVLTPVYNGAPYLAECIESVLSQTHQNWRYVILDNASTDGSGEIAEAYARKDPRIRVVHNDALIPMTKNINRLFTFVDSDVAYCKPLMADDWMFPECIEKLLEAAVAHPTIGLVSSPTFNGKDVWGIGIEYPAKFVPGRELCRRILLDGILVLGSETEVLIRADLVRKFQPFYTEEHFYADFESGFQMLQESDFAFVHQILTYARQHPGQVSARARWLEGWQLALMNVVLKYGPVFLTPHEQEARLQAGWRDYYRALARGVTQRKGKEFLDHHRVFLASKGRSIERRRLMKAVVHESMRVLASKVNDLLVRAAKLVMR